MLFKAHGRNALLLGDEPVLFFDDGARRSIAIEAAKGFARHSAIGPLILFDTKSKRVNSIRVAGFRAIFGLPSSFNDGFATRRSRSRAPRTVRVASPLLLERGHPRNDRQSHLRRRLRLW